MLSPTRRDLGHVETTRIESFSRSPLFEKPFTQRKREHSPEKQHFNFENSYIAAAAVAASKKPYIPTSEHHLYPVPNGQLLSMIPKTTPKPLFSYGTHNMPLVPNSPGGPGRDMPRMTRRDPVVPSRLSDYEIEQRFGAIHQRIPHDARRNNESGNKFRKEFKNGHHVVKNGHIGNHVAKKEPTKVPVNSTLPSNKSSLSNGVESVLSPKSSDEDSALSPTSPNSPFPREYKAPAERTRRTSSSSTDSGHEEARRGMRTREF